LDDPEAFAAAMYALTQQILCGEFAPGEVQKAYLWRFPRQNVIEEYMQVFGCCDTAQRKAKAV
jgi:hypothetical protein